MRKVSRPFPKVKRELRRTLLAHRFFLFLGPEGSKEGLLVGARRKEKVDSTFEGAGLWERKPC